MREPQAYDREGMPIYPDWQEGGRLQKDPKDDWGERDLYDWATCGTCGRRWNDALITGLTPAPSARCPFEYDHEYDEDDDDNGPTTILDVLDYLDGSGLVVTDEAEIAGALDRIGLKLADRIAGQS